MHNVCTDTGRFSRLRAEGLTMIDIKIDRKISPVANIKSVIKLYKLMRTENYDIVHVHTPIAAVLGRVAAKLAGVKNIVYTAHGFYFHDDMSPTVYRTFYLIEKFFARMFTDWLLLQSKEDYELCNTDHFKNKNRIIHISNGVDITTKFNPSLIDEKQQLNLREQFCINEHDIVFSFIGRFVREKGIFELLEAFHQLKVSCPNVKLLMIGDVLDSERDQESAVRLKQLLNDPSIIAPGFRKDVPELLSICDVYVLPSYREGLPRSIIEAMALAKPIIATDIRGCREEVFDSENGFLVRKGDSQHLYEKMKAMADDPTLRKRFGDKSRKLVEELFDEDKVVKIQLDLFEKLIH